ncbi:MAG: uroporphyrinogen-III C-methyltransferase [Acidobacteriota bacterium]
MSRKKGKVFLAGAGPGDPDLITVKAMEEISTADCIIYDFLAPAELLKHAKPDAELLYVGKKGGSHTLPQKEIGKLIVGKAKEGKVVVRLKGGDPFIFGRGGEEAEELKRDRVDFEVIPGVTSGIAAATYAGIPLTHRQYASSVSFITGHEDEEKAESTMDWDKLAMGADTLVIFMGFKKLEENIKQMINAGRSPRTPAAMIMWGTKPFQKTAVSTLARIAAEARRKGLKAPVILVVGSVVKLRNRLKWFENKPLFGKTIVVTRSGMQASEFSKYLRKMGANVIEFPTIDIVPPSSWMEVDRAIDDLLSYDIIIFTSINGVEFFFNRMQEKGKDSRFLGNAKVIAIGPATAEALRGRGIMADAVPSEYRAEGILESIGRFSPQGKKILIPRAEVARGLLKEKLEECGARVDIVVVYKNVVPQEGFDCLKRKFEKNEIDMVTFTSSSTVSNFTRIVGKDFIKKHMKHVSIASIGPITSETIRSLGMKIDTMAKKYTIPSLTDSIVRYFQKQPREKGR